MTTAYRSMCRRSAGVAALVALLGSSARPANAQQTSPKTLSLRLEGGFAGGAWISGYPGGLFGVWAQVGAQIKPTFAVYYQVHVLFGSGFFNAWGGPVPSDALVFNEVLMDFTIKDRLQLGIGPSIDYMGSKCIELDSCNQRVAVGGDARVAAAFGDWYRYGRAGFVVGLDLHPTFMAPYEGTSTQIVMSFLLTVGGGIY